MSEAASRVIRTPDQRLRVFVSSTLQEVADERKAARIAIEHLRLAPVLFELGARPHPPKELYRAYLDQSHIFVGIYWQKYGWVAPDMDVSGLEDEYNLSSDKPKLIYIKAPAPDREPRLKALLDRIRTDDRVSYKSFSEPDELRDLIENDLVMLLTEHFEMSQPVAEAAPIGPASPLPHLPVPPTKLIGREQELSTLHDWLQRGEVSLVTLTGPGGTGKTRLALQVGSETATQFADGVCFVPLASISDHRLVAATIAQMLGLKETPGTESMTAVLEDFLRDKQMLLLLDNFEQVIEAAPAVADLLEACHALKVIVTSRAPLRVRGEREFPVPPLALPPPDEALAYDRFSHYGAVELFIQRAVAVKPDFAVTNENAPAVAEICHRLDGLPLAIELAAVRIKLLSPQAMLSRLEHRLPLLTGGARDLPERQQTLRHTIDWSYNLLDEQAKRLFRRLAVFVGGWTLDAAERVCNLDGDLGAEVLTELEELSYNSLLKQAGASDDEMRFAMLETIREYALERLAARAEDEAIRRRHAQFFTESVEQIAMELRAGPTQLQRFALLEVEQGNIAAALAWSLGGADSELGLRLVGAIFYFWWRTGHWVEWGRWMALAPAHLDHVSEATRAATLVAMSGMDLYGKRDIEASRRHGQEALAIYRRLGDRRNIAWTIYWLATPAPGIAEEGIAEEYARSLALTEEAIALLRQVGDSAGVAWGFNQLGEYAYAYGDLVRAKAAYQESLRIAREIGDQLREHIQYLNLGNIALAEGDYDGAATLYRRSLVWARQSIATAFALNTLACLASVFDRQGQPQRAARLMGASEALRESAGTKLQLHEQRLYDQSVALVYEQLGEVTFNALRADGQAMTLDQAIEYALSQEGEI